MNASKFGKVLIITKKKLNDANTNYAQGGIAAVLSEKDDIKKHIKDTLEAGCYHNNLKSVNFLVKNGTQAVKTLLKQNIPFTLDQKGNFLLTKEGGHSENRVAYVGDYTGKAIEKALINNVKKNKNIEISENTLAFNLIVKNKTCFGVQVLKNKKIINIFANQIILATGGAGNIYKYTTNPEIATGDGIAMGEEAGCDIKDLEFIQFHPTALNINIKPLFLISESLRGEGAILLNSKSEKFMKKYHHLEDLAPRDIVARAIFEEEKKGPIYLDIRHEKADKIKIRFPKIYEKLLKHGIDMTKKLIPITPAAHYLCGGIQVNLKGKTNIKNLYAFGETACAGIHGANRLASNSLLEAAVFTNNFFKNYKGIRRNLNKKFIQVSSVKFTYKSLTKSEILKLNKIKSEIQEIMWKYVGIIRTKEGLKKCLKLLNNVQTRFIASWRQNNQINEQSIETKNMLKTAILITKSALKRRKSLGCHFII